MAISKVVPVTGSGGGMTASPQGRSVHPQPTLNRLGPLPSGAKAFTEAIQPYLLMAMKKQQAKQERERRSKAIQTAERTGDYSRLDPDLYTDAKNRKLKMDLLEEQIADRQERQRNREAFERGILGSKQEQEVKVLDIKQKYKKDEYNETESDYYKREEFKSLKEMAVRNDKAGIVEVRDRLLHKQKQQIEEASRAGGKDLEALKHIHKTERDEMNAVLRTSLAEMGIDSNQFMQEVGHLHKTSERKAKHQDAIEIQARSFTQQDLAADIKYQRESTQNAYNWDRKFEKQAVTQEGLNKRASQIQEGLERRLGKKLSAKEEFAVREYARKSSLEKFKADLSDKHMGYGKGGLTAMQMMKRNDQIDQMNHMDRLMFDMEELMQGPEWIVGGKGKMRRFVEFWPKLFGQEGKYPASEFLYMRNMLSVLISKPLMKESRLSDKERARVDRLISGGSFWDNPADVKIAFDAVRKVLRTSRGKMGMGRGRSSSSGGGTLSDGSSVTD